MQVQAAAALRGRPAGIREVAALEAHAYELARLARDLGGCGRDGPGEAVERAVALGEQRHARTARDGLEDLAEAPQAHVALLDDDGAEVAHEQLGHGAQMQQVLRGDEIALLAHGGAHEHGVEVEHVVADEQVGRFDAGEVVIGVVVAQLGEQARERMREPPDAAVAFTMLEALLCGRVQAGHCSSQDRTAEPFIKLTECMVLRTARFRGSRHPHRHNHAGQMSQSAMRTKLRPPIS